MKYLLDTNIVSAVMNDPGGTVARRLTRIGEQDAITSVVVLCELRFGVLKKASARLERNLASILRKLEVLPLSPPVAEHYAAIRVQLERSGTPIGSNDMLIAAHAIALDATLVTDNTREFSRVPGLKFENWMR